MHKMKLYGFDRCGQCQQVKGAMKGHGLDYDYIRIDPDDRRPVEEVSGQPFVPVLVDGENVLVNVDDILEYLKKKS